MIELAKSVLKAKQEKRDATKLRVNNAAAATEETRNDEIESEELTDHSPESRVKVAPAFMIKLIIGLNSAAYFCYGK